MPPRYVELIRPDPTGVVDPAQLPHDLPFNLVPRDFFRTVEDIHEVLHDLNTMMHQRGYQRMEELLDPAGFSGMISRTGASRLARASHALVVNRRHNGYPDLIVDGQYPANSVQRGEGGLEIKASRSGRSWQTHGPRAGWFCVFQFALDEREEVALFDREPTRVLAVLVAELDLDDWNWQPAKEGKIRSGTASMRASGVAKCRAGAVWVDPPYQNEHEGLLTKARFDAFRDDAPRLVEQRMREGDVTVDAMAEALLSISPGDIDVTKRRVRSTLANLRKAARADLIDKEWRLLGTAEVVAKPVVEE